jgi:hypothetical protein
MEAYHDLCETVVAQQARVDAETAQLARSIDDLARFSRSLTVVEEAEQTPAQASERVAEKGWSISVRNHTELVSQLAALLKTTKAKAASLVHESTSLVQQLPDTLDALEQGRIGHPNAQMMVDEVGSVPLEAAPELERVLLPLAEKLVPPKFRKRAAVIRERMHPDSAVERRDRALRWRDVTINPGRDGVGDLTVRLANEELVAAYNRLTAQAKALKAGGDKRSLPELRADVAAALFIDREVVPGADAGEGCDGLLRGIRAEVFLTVPVLSLLGVGDEPAMLEGMYPIDLDTAKELTRNAPGYYRVLTDPITGTRLVFEEKTRRFPPGLKRMLKVNDGQCRCVWCPKSASECDGHHVIPWSATHDTSYDNGVHLDPADHRLVHNTRWTMEKLDNGDVRWVAPAGFEFVDEAVPPSDPAPPELRERAASSTGAVRPSSSNSIDGPLDTTVDRPHDDLGDDEGEVFPF